jgi:hypothetical protein
MCYHLSFSTDIASIYDLLPDLLNTPLDIDFRPTYHMVGQAYPQWPVITNEGGQLKLKKFEWGRDRALHETREPGEGTSVDAKYPQ